MPNQLPPPPPDSIGENFPPAVRLVQRSIDITGAIDLDLSSRDGVKLDYDIIQKLTEDAMKPLFEARDRIVVHTAIEISGLPLTGLIGRLTHASIGDTPDAEEWYMDFVSEEERGTYLASIWFHAPITSYGLDGMTTDIGFAYSTILPDGIPEDVLKGTTPLADNLRKLIAEVATSALVTDTFPLAAMPGDPVAGEPIILEPSLGDLSGSEPVVLARPGQRSDPS